MRWLFWDNQKLSGTMAAYRYRRAFMPSSDPHVLAYMKGRIDDFLEVLDCHLRHRSFIVGEHPTVADLSMTGYLVFPQEESGYDPTLSHPAIGAWLQRVAALPGWKARYDMLPGKRLHRYV